MQDDNIQIIDSVEMFPIIAKDIVTNYCLEHRIEESDIFPSIWSDIIYEIYISLMKPNHKLLKLKGSSYNEYDKEAVEYVYLNVYKRLCDSHCQEVTLKGFCDMSGVEKQTLYNWKDGHNLNGVRFALHEKIMEDNEESLFNLMKDRRNNPMKLLPKLNKVHGWNMPGTRTQTDKNSNMSLEDLQSALKQLPNLSTVDKQIE